MQLIGSLTSPFVRVIRVLCAELGLEYDFKIMPPFAKMSEEEKTFIRKINPLMKIPVLVDGEQNIMESRIIAYYLMRKKSVPDLSIEEENSLSIINGAIDAAVLRYIMAIDQDRVDMDHAYLKKSHERIVTSLNYLNGQNWPKDRFGLCEISLMCMLLWFEKRKLFDWRPYKTLVEVYERCKDRPSLVSTAIPDNA